MSLKIGIVLNKKEAEKKKDELLSVNSRKRPWLKLAPKDLIIYRNKKPYIPADVAIGLFIEKYYPDINVDFIKPSEISLRRFHKNDINFILIYDLLEAFHLAGKSGWKEYDRYKHILKTANNIYPPYEYQKFVNNKCLYYKYLEKMKIPVAPTYCISGKKWFERNPKKYTQKLLDKIVTNKWKEFIAKPVLGQESLDFMKFKKCPSSTSFECRRKRLKKYLHKIIPKYKEVILQEYIPGFDQNNPEYRMYFINGKYSYTIITTSNIVARPKQEGGKKDVKNWKYLLTFGKKVYKALEKNWDVPILTRIDVGTGLEKVKHGFFVNEIEFVPSLYIEDHPFPVDVELAHGIVEVASDFTNEN